MLHITLSTQRIFVILLAVLDVTVTSSFTFLPVPTLSVDQFQARICDTTAADAEMPFVVKGALSLDKCEAMCDDIVSAADVNDEDCAVVVQMQRKVPGFEPQVYPMDLRDALEALMSQSRHGDALWCFEEGFLEEYAPRVSVEGRQLLESTFASSPSPSSERDTVVGENWFNWFPEWARPTDCLILAGEGATSTLHRDPFEWTGTSLCLEGTKIWRFIEPAQNQNTGTGGVETIDQILDSYRLASTAWDLDGDRVLSAGWQSDKSLYATRTKGIQSARQWQDVEEAERFKQMQQIAQSGDQLTPDLGSEGEGTNELKIWGTVQCPGDVVVIPAHWWHQTYGLEPSVAVASQRCSNQEARRVLQHMVDSTDAAISPKELNSLLELSNPKKTVEGFFDLLNKHL
jgi:hypothetical protein